MKPPRTLPVYDTSGSVAEAQGVWRIYSISSKQVPQRTFIQIML